MRHLHSRLGSTVADKWCGLTLTALSGHGAIGGLLLDIGVLSLRHSALDASFYPDPNSGIPKLLPSHPAIIEWRAMTVIELYV